METSRDPSVDVARGSTVNVTKSLHTDILCFRPTAHVTAANPQPTYILHLNNSPARLPLLYAAIRQQRMLTAPWVVPHGRLTPMFLFIQPAQETPGGNPCGG
ncbi:hypothetical protein J6590_001547 [Homalodisca vitripennis]|nr:hypothetical protein J6590_001547 [Homalodisca vitripennis]